MGIIIIKKNLSKSDFQKAKEDYVSYIKVTADIEQEVIALGGEYHADAEKILLKNGSSQKNIWGGGVNLEIKQYEANAIVNLRPGQNDSTEILNLTKRKKFLRLAKKLLDKYVK